MHVLHTPGHSPGCCCFRDAEQGVVFSGDTLFCGGPGATGRSYSDEPTILRSIRDTLLALPDDTVVHTGHGESTTIGAERERVLERANRARRLTSVRRNRITTIGIDRQNDQQVRPGTCCTAATWYVTSLSVKNVSWLASANTGSASCGGQLSALRSVGEADGARQPATARPSARRRTSSSSRSTGVAWIRYVVAAYGSSGPS